MGGTVTRAPLEQAVQLVCRGCHEGTVVIEMRARPENPWSPVFWWPTPGAGTLDDSIPDNVRKAFDEGVRCLSIQVPNAAAAMLRSALAQIVQDKGSDAARTKRSLKEAVKQMVSDGTLWPTFGDWADHIREIGNAGAHPEIFGEVSQGEADDLQRLVRQLLEILYVQPASIERARAARQ